MMTSICALDPCKKTMYVGLDCYKPCGVSRRRKSRDKEQTHGKTDQR